LTRDKGAGRRLDSEDVKVREKAARKLAYMGEAAVDPLIETPRGQFQLLYGPQYALSKIGEPAIEPLVGVLKDKNSNDAMQLGTAVAFSYMSEDASESLISVLRAKAAKPLIETLGQDYCQRNVFICTAICAALGRIGDPKAILPLTKTLEIWKHKQQAYNIIREAIEKIQGRA